MELKITLANVFKATKFIWISTILITLLCWYYNFNFYIILGAGAYHLLLISFAIYLHFEYYIKNRGQKIIINSTGLSITERDGSERHYDSTDLDRVIVYRSASLDKGGIQLSAMESYSYARIIAKNNEEIIITCLLTPDVDEAVRSIRGIKYERKKRAFCSIGWK